MATVAQVMQSVLKKLDTEIKFYPLELCSLLNSSQVRTKPSMRRMVELVVV